MTTARSPYRVLRDQANRIAELLKAIERGDPAALATGMGKKIADARTKPTVKFAIAMDDKAITVEYPWSIIHDYSEREISDYILQLMQEAK